MRPYSALISTCTTCAPFPRISCAYLCSASEVLRTCFRDQRHVYIALLLVANVVQYILVLNPLGYALGQLGHLASVALLDDMETRHRLS